MSLIKTIDRGIRKAVFSVFWFLMDPLEAERLYSELTDVIDRNLDANTPNKLFAPDSFDVLVNNSVFIKHAHAIKKLESAMAERLRKYIADRDYELLASGIQLQIISSATISKHKADVRCRFSPEDSAPAESATRYHLKIIQGEGAGSSWQLMPGSTYEIGRISTADICLPFENISKKQATLYFVSADKITIVDEGSANGTFIDDEEEPIKGSRELRVGHKIKFCKLNPIVLALTDA